MQIIKRASPTSIAVDREIILKDVFSLFPNLRSSLLLFLLSISTQLEFTDMHHGLAPHKLTYSRGLSFQNSGKAYYRTTAAKRINTNQMVQIYMTMQMLFVKGRESHRLRD